MRKKRVCFTEDGTPADDLPNFKLRDAIHALVKSFPSLDVEWTTWALLNVAAHELASIPDEDHRVVMLAKCVKLLAGATAHIADDIDSGHDGDDYEGDEVD